MFNSFFYRRKITSIAQFFAFLVVFFAAALPVSAHTEYEEIQVKSTFQVDKQKHLTAINMVWLYDTFSSQDRISHEKDLNKLAKILVSDLARFNYYTRLNSGDRRLITNKLNNYKLIETKDEYGNPALQLTVSLLIKKPIKINDLRDIKINHADPTGKAILYYQSATDIVLENELKSRCKPEVKEKASFNAGEFPQIATVTCTA